MNEPRKKLKQNCDFSFSLKLFFFHKMNEMKQFYCIPIFNNLMDNKIMVQIFIAIITYT